MPQDTPNQSMRLQRQKGLFDLSGQDAVRAVCNTTPTTNTSVGSKPRENSVG